MPTIKTLPAVTVPPPAVASTTGDRRPADPGSVVAIHPSGRLRLPSTTDLRAGAMHRRTGTGTIYRIDLGENINCWLDGDQHDGSGEVNLVATAMCAALSGGAFSGPDDAPFVCGLVLFTGIRHRLGTATGPVALTDAQLRRIVNAHAAASDDVDAPTWTGPINHAASPQLIAV